VLTAGPPVDFLSGNPVILAGGAREKGAAAGNSHSYFYSPEFACLP